MSELLSRLKDVMAVQTTSYNTKLMNEFIIKTASQIKGCKIVKNNGNIYITRGSAEIYPCVVAHTDTVHDIFPQFHVQQLGNVLYAINQDYERVGVGGDDKVGVFVALESLRANKICKVAFFRDEEVGCHGSKVADMSFFKDVSFVMQCDRQGYSDFVSSIFYTEMYSAEFSSAITDLLIKYGRNESDGGLTDVYQLAENGLEVCCANMSCGYYDPHSDNEYIKIDEVFATLEFVKELINDFGDIKWELKSEDRNSYGGYYGGGSKGKSYRRYGKGKESSTNAYKRHFPDAWDFEDLAEDNHEEELDKKGYLVKSATCCQCEGAETIHWDEFVMMYYCFGCQDYVRDEVVEFPSAEKEGSFLELVEEQQKLIDKMGITGVDPTYDQNKEV
jgi:hypothetical protein